MIKVAGVSLLALTTILHASATANEADVKQFQILYDELHIGMNQRDREKVLSFLSPDFVSTELSGKTQNAEQMVDELEALPKSSNQKERKTIVLNATKVGALCEVEQAFHSVKVNTDSAGANTTIEFNAKSHDTWILTTGKWLMKSTRTDELEMKKDGVVVVHKVRPTI
jgi:hypothetical protein